MGEKPIVEAESSLRATAKREIPELVLYGVCNPEFARLGLGGNTEQWNQISGGGELQVDPSL